MALHDAEKPIAYLHQRLIAVNTTESKDIPPIEDLFLFRQRQPGELPPAAAGAAMLALVELDQCPSFALAFYESLAAAGRDQTAPPRLALIAKDAILLAPMPCHGSWSGFLIADCSAANQVREFHLPGDEDPIARLLVPPPADGSVVGVWAAESSTLPIV